MNDPMNDLLKEISQSSLSPAETERLGQLNNSILHKVKEKEEMKNCGTYCKRSAQAVAAAVAFVLAFGSVTTIAAYRLLNPSQVASGIENKKLASAFQGSDALFINETQSFQDYEVTLLGYTAGKNMSDTIPADLAKDEIYAVLALKHTGDAPMPEYGTEEYARLTFFPSFYIQGLDPLRYNLDGMNGWYTSCVKNGVSYYIVAMSNIEIFADKDIYVGLCSAGRDGDYNPDAYTFHKKTGAITRSKTFSGVNALFVLPVDKNKADPEKAKKFMNNFKDSAVSDSSGLSKDEKKREWANTRICQLAAKFIKTLTPENINDLCEVADSQICIPDKNGVFTYSFPIGDSDTGYHTEKVKDCLKDPAPGVLNINDGVGLSGGSDHYYRIGTLDILTYQMNPDGTITRTVYRPNKKSVTKINKKFKADLKEYNSRQSG